MLNPLPPRLRSRAVAVIARRSLPPLLLSLAMAWTLLLNLDREHYYAPLEWHTAQKLAVAENLSPSHNFRLFIYASFDDEGEPVYVPYSRFPIGGSALIKLAMLPFGENMAAKIFAARMLMLAFFGAAAFLAYRAVSRIACNRWIGLTAALLAFASHYILHNHNKVSNELMMDLFGVMLTFHGMVVFVQEGRFRQLLIKTCIALLIGWHVYAFLLPFIAIGFGQELINAVKARSGASRIGTRPLVAVATTSPRLRLGAAAALFGMLLLAFNVVSEYDALSGESALTELPTVNSVIGRLTGDSAVDEDFAWSKFLRGQFYRAAGAVLPAAAGWPAIRLEESPSGPPLPLASIGILAAAAALVGLPLFPRRRLLLATLTLSGFCWALIVRGSAFFPAHQFEAIYYVGLPLTLTLSLLAAAADKPIGARLLPIAAAAAALVFAISAHQEITGASDAGEKADLQQTALADLANIRRVAHGKNVLVGLDGPVLDVWVGSARALDFLLRGSRLRYDRLDLPGHDFVLTAHRDETLHPATPGNRLLFLYADANPIALMRSQFNSIIAGASGHPDARSVYDVFFSSSGGALTYVKASCGPPEEESRFFAHIFPENENDLPARRRGLGYDNADFEFLMRGVRVDGACAASVPLPDYAIRAVRTGQFNADGELWNAAFAVDPDSYRAVYESAVSQEPDAQAAFNLYLNEEERTLTYAREPCAASDVRPPFFLHVTPERQDDLPADRREFGFDNLDFDFRLRGAVFEGACAASVPLPAYGVASIRTGQWERNEGEIWAAAIPIPE